MDYQTFKAVVAGNLINEPEQLKFKSGWLTDDPNKEHWKRLAIEGTYPEAIYATNSYLLLSLLIGAGHGQEHYREWSEKARGFNPGMNQANGMFKYTYFK